MKVPIRFSARPGLGAFLNGRRIHVSKNADMRSALFLVSIHESVKGMLDVVKADINVKPVGSIAYKMCLVAAGKGDATFTVNPRHDWDIAAATLIVTEAGGKVTDSRGNPTFVNSQTLVSDGVIVSNGLIHDGIVPVCAMVREQLALAQPRPV